MSRRVRFEPDRKKKIPKSFIVGAFVTVLVLTVVISSFVILKNNNFDFIAAIGGESDGTDEDAEETTVTSTETRYFLFWCKNSETSRLEFLWIVGVSLPDGKYRIYSPSIDYNANYDGSYSSLADIFGTYGAEGLKKACESLCDITINAYIGSDTENFKQMINKLGSVTVNISEHIEYKGDFNLILSSGDNTLKGDQLYKYLCYTNYIDYGASSMRIEVMKKILENTVNPDELSDTDSLYSNIANLLISDITIVDYSTSADFINQMFTSGVKTVIEVTDPSGLNKE